MSYIWAINQKVQMNVIDESGILAISTRLQRLADTLRKDGVLIYKANNIEFEPKWFPVIYTLHFKPVLSVVELANEIGYTHPSTISLLKELEKEKLIRSKKDKADERKRLIQLTAKGQEMVERMQPVWEIMKAAAAELTNTQNNVMKAIAEVEEQINQQSFFARAQKLKAAK
nr:MarR family transcriptional regulator [Mucilaginibacter sp. FT3.2]